MFTSGAFDVLPPCLLLQDSPPEREQEENIGMEEKDYREIFNGRKDAGLCTKPVYCRERGHLGPCRKCEECVKARKRSYTGRILAEMIYAHTTHFFTFTYGGGYNNPDAYVLDYTHFQKLVAHWRDDLGYKFRYLVVGEFGDERQRAHWHAMIFWETHHQPELILDERINYDWWPHGTVQAELPRSGQGSASYIMDYLDKDGMKTTLKASKRPPLGDRFLLEYAVEHARKGVPIFGSGNVYTLPGNLNKDGKPFYYPVEKTRAIYHKMVLTWISEFERHYPDRPPRLSPTLKEWMLDNADAGFVAHVKTEHAYFAVKALEKWGYRQEEYPGIGDQSYETLDVPEDIMLHRHQYGARLVLFGRAGSIIWQQDVGKALARVHEVRRRANPLGDHPPEPPRNFGAYTPETGGYPEPILLSKTHELIHLYRRSIKRAVWQDWIGTGERSPQR